MSKAQRKTKSIKLVIPEDQPSIAAEDHRVITKDEVAQRAYELFLARGRGWRGGRCAYPELAVVRSIDFG